MTRVARESNFRSKSDANNENKRGIVFRNTFLPDSTLRRLELKCVRGDMNDPFWLNARKVDGFPDWYYMPWFGYY